MGFVIFVGAWLLLHLYVGWRAWSVLESRRSRAVLVVSMTLGFLLYPVGRFTFFHASASVGRVLEYGGAVWIGIILLTVPALMTVDAMTLFGLVFRDRLRPLRMGALLLALGLSLVAWVGGERAPRVVAIEVEMPRLPPGADGLVVAQLSDLHLGTLIGEGRLEAVIAQIDAMDADVIAITGDLVDADVELVRTMLPTLERLRAPRGVFAVLGNHERFVGAKASRSLMREAGFDVLEGNALEVAEGLWIAGIGDQIRAFDGLGREHLIRNSLASVPADAAVIYLAHAPGAEREIAAAGVGLLLNGHTHGAQIWPAHLLVRWVYPRLGGVFTEGEMTQVVCRGAGQWGPPMRLFAPSEIYRITLRSPDRRATRTER
jgi:predicted MPP superfamily phosphohydrolase